MSLIYVYVYSHHDVTPITMALNGASSSPGACQALASMLSRNTLNPADISVLFRNYSTAEPPPIELLRNPQFLGINIIYYYYYLLLELLLELFLELIHTTL